MAISNYTFPAWARLHVSTDTLAGAASAILAPDMAPLLSQTGLTQYCITFLSDRTIVALVTDEVFSITYSEDFSTVTPNQADGATNRIFAYDEAAGTWSEMTDEFEAAAAEAGYDLPALFLDSSSYGMATSFDLGVYWGEDLLASTLAALVVDPAAYVWYCWDGDTTGLTISDTGMTDTTGNVYIDPTFDYTGDMLTLCADSGVTGIDALAALRCFDAYNGPAKAGYGSYYYWHWSSDGDFYGSEALKMSLATEDEATINDLPGRGLWAGSKTAQLWTKFEAVAEDPVKDFWNGYVAGRTSVNTPAFAEGASAFEKGYRAGCKVRLKQWDTEGDKPYLTFSAPGEFALNVASPGWDGTMEVSTDDAATWATWDGSAVTGTKILVRGTGNTKVTGSYSGGWSLTPTDDGTLVSCNGNIEMLLDYATAAAGEHPEMAEYCYQYMFYGCTALTTAPALPATTLMLRCYQYMFYGCTALTTAPALPATKLVGYCYNSMFYGCTALTTAPALPATATADACYAAMFYGCTALVSAPALPATKLVGYCYSIMFHGCTALTTAPALPATTLVNHCYQYMFQGCTALTTAPALPATKLVGYCYNSMFQGCGARFATSQSDEYPNAYRIPSSGTGTTGIYSLNDMLSDPDGNNFTPSINTTYYTNAEVIYP